ncbi:MAG: tyrosine-type recombinase/integrase [Abitibacteriaceae bacterium]|nr:tyrosine-type recombinase/integrase [Abditibacteriaceae bacterium]
MEKTQPAFQKIKAGESSPSGAQIKLEDLNRLAQEWLLDGDFRQHSPRTLEFRRDFARKLLWFLTQRNSEVCGVAELRLLLAHIANGHKDGCGRWGNPRNRYPVRSATLHRYYRELRTLFNWIVQEGTLATSPLDCIATPLLRSEQVQPFTANQTTALISAAQRSLHARRNVAIVHFLLDIGCRASEMCTLRMRDLDLQGHRATVQGKGNKRRLVYFGRGTSKSLWQYLKEQHRDEGDAFFCRIEGYVRERPSHGTGYCN